MSNKYISDCHFHHKNILRYDNRPWMTVEDMDAGMVCLWNEGVDPSDTVYILGDVVWSDDVDDWKNVLSQLNGHKTIIKGNHDKSRLLDQLVDLDVIESWSQQTTVKDKLPGQKDQFVVLNHSPMPFFVNCHHDNWHHLYGHVHISFDYQIIKHIRRQVEELYLHPMRMYNVGCMIRGMDYVPRTLEEIVGIDAENRAFEEGHLEDYLSADKVRGHDKVETVNNDNH